MEKQVFWIIVIAVISISLIVIGILASGMYINLQTKFSSIFIREVSP